MADPWKDWFQLKTWEKIVNSRMNWFFGMSFCCINFHPTNPLTYPSSLSLYLTHTHTHTHTHKYSQTWGNDHFWIATTCLQQPLFWGPNKTFYNINDLRTTTTHQRRPLFLGAEGGRYTQVWLYSILSMFVQCVSWWVNNLNFTTHLAANVGTSV